jgi:hypothetical protein
MKVKVRNSKYGCQYQIENDRGFTYFPNGVTTIPAMKHYFVNGGHMSIKGSFDEPDIVFCNQAGQPAKLYTIRSGEKLLGQRIATVDYDKKFIFVDITTDADKLDFLRNHSTRVQDQEADRLETDQEKIKFYLNNCTEETKLQFKELIDSALTSDVLKQQCEENAKGYNLPAEVIFEI